MWHLRWVLLPPVPARARAALERPAFRLVAECAAYLPDGWEAQRARVTRALERDPDPAEVLALATRHQLAAMAERVISRTQENGGRPGTLLQALRPAARRSALRSLEYHAELGRLLAAFAARGLPAVALKGTGLSQRLYGEVGLRFVADIDLLVAPERLAEAARVLESCGYRVDLPEAMRTGSRLELVRLAGHEIRCERDGGYQVDLHWRVESAPRSRFEPLWRPWLDDARGGDLRELLYLCLHGARHDWIRLKWLGDVHAWLSRLPAGAWTELEELAVQLRLEAVLGETLVLRQWIFGAPPEDAMGRLLASARQESARGATSAVTKLLGPPPGEENDTLAQAWHGLRLHWRLERRYPVGERLRHWASWLVFHEQDVKALQLPPWAFPAYMISRPLRVLRRYAFRRRSGTRPRS